MFLVIFFSVANRTSGVVEAWVIKFDFFQFFNNQTLDNIFKMSEVEKVKADNIPQDVLDQLKATNGQVITCKAAVSWEPKKPLDVTDIQVRIFRSTCAGA